LERPGVGGYRLEQLLGRGGTSVVYRAYDEGLDRNVAVKVLSPELAEDDRFRERFLRESKLAVSIEHPHIIPVYDAGESEGVLFIAMRYVEGTDLKALLQREHALEPQRALAIVAQVADALDTAHARGLIHRDVKPSNVLVAPGDHVYLADFGLTKSNSDRTTATMSGQLVGTVDYVAPEQIEGKPLDGRADVYSLGCLFYECLTGEPPFPRDSELAVLWAHVQQEPPRVSEHRPELPQALDEVIAKALAKDPAKRYATAAELVGAASAVLRAPTRPGLRLPLVAAALVLAAAATVAGLLLTRGGSPVAPLTTSDGIARIDPQTNRLSAAIQVARGTVDLATGFGAVWLANAEAQSVENIDPKINSVVHEVGLAGPGSHTSPLAIATGEGNVWVSEGLGARVAAARYGGPYAATISLGKGGPAIDVTTGTGSVWAATFLDQRIWRIDLGSVGNVNIVATIPIAVHPSALAFGAEALWVASIDNALVKIDARTNRVAATIPLTFTPGGITFAMGRIWLSNPAANTVVSVDAGNLRGPRKVIRVGANPSGVAVGFGSLWVANSGDGTVSRVDPLGGRVVATTEVGPRPDRIAAGAGGVWAVTHGR